MSKIKEVSTLVETKFISLYDIKYLNKCNEEKVEGDRKDA